MYLFREALPTFNANPEGGSFIITSSTAAVTAAGSSLPYSVTKAAGRNHLDTGHRVFFLTMQRVTSHEVPCPDTR